MELTKIFEVIEDALKYKDLALQMLRKENGELAEENRKLKAELRKEGDCYVQD